MYRTTNFIDRTKDICDQVIAIERDRYRPYYQLIIDHLREHAGPNPPILGGKIACDVYINNKYDIDRITRDAKPIIVHSDQPFAFAKQLIDKLFAATKNIYLLVLPVFSDEEYEVMISGFRKLCVVRNLGTYRDTQLSTLMRPKKIAGLHLINPELLLVGIYRQFFYDLADEDEDAIKESFAREAALFSHFVADVKRGKLDVRPATRVTRGSDDSIVDLRRQLIAALKDHLIIGKQGIKPTSGLDQLQFITELDDKDIFERLKQVSPPTGTLDIARYSLSLPIDSRLRRFRIFVASGGSARQRVADIYTAGQYDLYTLHPFLFLRFIFVDLWTINLIHAIGDLDAHTAQREIDRLIDEAIAVHESLVASTIPTADFSSFRGQYVDEMVARQRAKKFARRNNDDMYYAAYREQFEREAAARPAKTPHAKTNMPAAKK